MEPTMAIIGAFIGFGMWFLSSISYGWRLPLWYLLLLMAVMMMLVSNLEYFFGSPIDV